MGRESADSRVNGYGVWTVWYGDVGQYTPNPHTDICIHIWIHMVHAARSEDRCSRETSHHHCSRMAVQSGPIRQASQRPRPSSAIRLRRQSCCHQTHHMYTEYRMAGYISPPHGLSIPQFMLRAASPHSRETLARDAADAGDAAALISCCTCCARTSGASSSSPTAVNSYPF